MSAMSPPATIGSGTISSNTIAPGPIWRLLAWLLALGLALNGLYMLVFAASWYAAVPGVRETGPLNDHFVHDIGAAFLAAAVSAGLAARAADRRLLVPAAVFLVLHSGQHVMEAFEHGLAAGIVLQTEIFGIHLPALLALALVLPARWQALLPIPARLIENRIAASEKVLGVRLDYMREMAAARSPLLFKLGRLMRLHRSGRYETPAEIRHFAALGATQYDDCGECLQIGINLARADGIDPGLLQAVLQRQIETLPTHLALAWRFGQAVAANDPAMEEARLELESRYGRRAIMELSYDLAMARFYPTVKRALGYAKSCSVIRLRVA